MFLYVATKLIKYLFYSCMKDTLWHQRLATNYFKYLGPLALKRLDSQEDLGSTLKHTPLILFTGQKTYIQ